MLLHVPAAMAVVPVSATEVVEEVTEVATGAAEAENPMTQHHQTVSVQLGLSSAVEILAILLQTSIANQKRLGQINGVDVVLQAVAMYKSRDPKSLDEEEMVENLFDCLCCLLMPMENKEKFLKAEGVELMIIIMNLKKLCCGSAIRALDFAMTNYSPACKLIWGWIWRKDGYTLHT